MTAARPPSTGGKAAALARAANAGLATLPGVVLTTAFSDAVDAGANVPRHTGGAGGVRAGRWRRTALVARSSSVVEDTAASSMAGQFDSVIGIHGFDAFVAAVEAVLDSRERAGAADQPIAVLVQPLIDPTFGGVMFGIDPVSGRTDRRVVSAVRGGPEPLVSGEVDGSRYVSRCPARCSSSTPNDGPALDPGGDLRRLVALSDQGRRGVRRAAGRRVGDRRRRAAVAAPVAPGHDRDPRCAARTGLRPGPGAETFPSPLTELEQDLWVPPLRKQSRSRPARRRGDRRRTSAPARSSSASTGTSPSTSASRGRSRRRTGVLHKLNPIPAVRRLRAPGGSGRRCATSAGRAPARPHRRRPRGRPAFRPDEPPADRAAAPQPGDPARPARPRDPHGHAHRHRRQPHDRRVGGAAGARRSAQDGLSDEEILARSPTVLALTAPRVARAGAAPDAVVGLPRRRARQLQRQRHPPRGPPTAGPLGARALGSRRWELGERLGRRRPHRARAHPPHDARAPGGGRDQASRRGARPRVDPRPRLRCPASRLVPAVRPGDGRSGRNVPGEVGGGTGAGGGTGSGPVTYDADDPPGGSVLVTTTLSPGLGRCCPA